MKIAVVSITKHGITLAGKVVAALPGAQILELDAEGFRPVTWDELTVVDHYRRFLAAPSQFLRHVLPD